MALGKEHVNIGLELMDTESDLDSDRDLEGSDSESDNDDETKKNICMRRKLHISKGSHFQILKSSDLRSIRLHEITTELFELREKGGVVSQRKLDRVTKQYHLHFTHAGQLNMASIMKLLKFKNLYFRKDYEKGIRVLKRLDREMKRMCTKDEPYIRGKLQFNLAFAYHALKKTELARQCLERAKLYLQFTEGGEDKADLYYFEGKLMDFYVQQCKMNNPRISEYRAKAVDAYRLSRDNVLFDGNDDYLKQRAMYRSLAICKVHLDYPEMDTCRNRNIVTAHDTKQAEQLLNEIMSNNFLSPRLESRLSLASAELHYRKYQLHLRNNEVNKALKEIQKAQELATNVNNRLKDTSFIEKQTSDKMAKYYEPLSDKLETQLRATVTKDALVLLTTESAKETKGEQNSKMTPSTKYAKEYINVKLMAYHELLDIQTSSSDMSSCETWLSIENPDRESDCML